MMRRSIDPTASGATRIWRGKQNFFARWAADDFADLRKEVDTENIGQHDLHDALL